MKSQKRNIERNRGQVVILAVILFSFGSFIFVSGVMSQVLSDTKAANNSIRSKQSYYLAESGIEDVIYRIVTNKSTSASETLSLGGSTTTIDTVDVGGGRKEITAEGDVTNLIRRITTELITSTTGVSFFYGAQVGEGGLEMSNNSRIEGVGGTVGNVYSNGPIVGGPGATITGDAVVATGLTEDVQARSLVCNQDQIVGKTNPQIDFAQSFSPASTGPLAKISIYIKKVGNPGSRQVKIVSDNADSPNTVTIEEGTLNNALVGTSYGWVDVVFPTPPVLTGGTTYWIVLDAIKNNSKYWIWCSDSNNGFGNGVAKYSQDWVNDSWTLIIGDLAFKTYTGEGVSSIDGVTVGGDARANSITNSSICGDAYYQTIDATSLDFVNSPTNPTCSDPLTPGATFPGSMDSAPLNMPLSSAIITDWKSEALAGGTIVGNCGDTGEPSCVIDDDETLSIGPKKIDGNLVLSRRQTLNLTGVVHVTGDFDIDGNNTIIKCDASFGSSGCTLVIDGWIHIQNNATFSGSGDPDSYIMILTTLQGCTGSGGSGCTHHDGAMDLHNNAGGAIFYSTDSMINLHNGVNVTSAVAYKLRLDNTAVITYESGTNSASFSSGPSGGWSIDKWEEVE